MSLQMNDLDWATAPGLLHLYPMHSAKQLQLQLGAQGAKHDEEGEKLGNNEDGKDDQGQPADLVMVKVEIV